MAKTTFSGPVYADDFETELSNSVPQYMGPVEASIGLIVAEEDTGLAAKLGDIDDDFNKQSVSGKDRGLMVVDLDTGIIYTALNPQPAARWEGSNDTEITPA